MKINKKKRKAVAMVRALLKEANKDSETIRHVWSLLSALRGPDTSDNECGTVKSETTAVIRGLLLPVTSVSSLHYHWQTGALVHHKGTLPDRNYLYPDVLKSHFAIHVRDAVDVLEHAAKRRGDK